MRDTFLAREDPNGYELYFFPAEMLIRFVRDNSVVAFVFRRIGFRNNREIFERRSALA